MQVLRAECEVMHDVTWNPGLPGDDGIYRGHDPAGEPAPEQLTLPLDELGDLAWGWKGQDFVVRSTSDSIIPELWGYVDTINKAEFREQTTSDHAIPTFGSLTVATVPGANADEPSLVDRIETLERLVARMQLFIGSHYD